MSSTKNSDNKDGLSVTVTNVIYKPNNNLNKKISCTITFKNKIYTIIDGEITEAANQKVSSTSSTQTTEKEDPNIATLQKMFNSNNDNIPLTFTVEAVN